MAGIIHCTPLDCLLGQFSMWLVLRIFKPLLLVLFLGTVWFSTILTSAQDNATQDEKIASAITKAILRVTVNPKDEATLTEARGLGFALIRVGRFEQATQVFRGIIKAVPNDELALYGNALSLFNLKRLNEAEGIARTAIKEAGVKLAEKKQDEQSLSLVKKNTTDNLVLLAVIVAVKGDNAAALNYLQQAVEYSPDNFDAQFSLGRAYYGNGDLASAVKSFQKAIALQPKNENALFFLATTLERLGEDASALSVYKNLVIISPNNADGYLGVGMLLLKLEGDKSVEGQTALRRAISLNADLYEARVSLGRALVKMNKADEAIEHLRKAAQLKPDNPEPHYQLALAYRKLGKNTEANEEFNLVKKINESRRVIKNNN